jgi:hypothetical protein
MCASDVCHLKNVDSGNNSEYGWVFVGASNAVVAAFGMVVVIVVDVVVSMGIDVEFTWGFGLSSIIDGRSFSEAEVIACGCMFVSFAVASVTCAKLAVVVALVVVEISLLVVADVVVCDTGGCGVFDGSVSVDVVVPGVDNKEEIKVVF